MSIVERFKDRLEGLELERLKVARDRQTYRFLGCLTGALSLLSFIASIVGQSALVAVMAAFLAICAGLVWRARKTLGEAFQVRFRDQITREWFHERFRSAYLNPPPDVISEELRVALREAIVRSTAQNPKKTVIEERLLFDRDSYSSLVLILREGPVLKPRSRALVWCKLRTDENGLVAFVWPPALATQKKPDLRFFENGKRVGLKEPLATKLESLYELARAKWVSQTVRVGYSPRGVFAGVRLSRRLFEAPLDQSLLDEAAYEVWSKDASLLLDSSVRDALNSIF